MNRMIGFVKNWAPRVGGLGTASTRAEIEAEIMKSFKESANAYFEAAEKFPEDDEAHACWSPLSSLFVRLLANLLLRNRVSQLRYRHLLAYWYSPQGFSSHNGTHSQSS